MTAGAIAPQAPDCVGEQKVTLSDALGRQEPAASHAMTQAAPSPLGATLTLRVTEARVEDVGHAIEGLTGADIESLCKKATLLAIVEFQEGTRVPPFVVLRSDFQVVLESDRGSPKKLKKTNSLRNGADDLCSAAHELSDDEGGS